MIIRIDQLLGKDQLLYRSYNDNFVITWNVTMYKYLRVGNYTQQISENILIPKANRMFIEIIHT